MYFSPCGLLDFLNFFIKALEERAKLSFSYKSIFLCADGGGGEEPASPSLLTQKSRCLWLNSTKHRNHFPWVASVQQTISGSPPLQVLFGNAACHGAAAPPVRE